MTTTKNHKTLYGFHAVEVRIKVAPGSVRELYFDEARRDARMRQFLLKADAAGLHPIAVDSHRLDRLCGQKAHQGVFARVDEHHVAGPSLDDYLDSIHPQAPLLLILDGVTDVHNLGACLRVADGAGIHAIIAPKDHAAGINATVEKVASGAAQTVPYFMVTNLARTMGELKERSIWCIGTAEDAPQSLYQADFTLPTAIVLGAEGTGMRALTRKTCDSLVHIPMRGAVESLNVSVASAVLAYEALRQRHGPSAAKPNAGI